jgi:hypothetical protein
VRALKRIRFENEFAAVVAAAQSLATQAVAGSAELGPTWHQAVRESVRTLYRSGYDPRGVASFWKGWGVLASQGFWAGAQRISWASLSGELEILAHDEIAKLPPLLNPVVRTPEFAKIGKRLQKL